MKTQNERVALITGGNRGIGFEVCRQLAAKGIRVILTSRNPDKGLAATKILLSEGLDITYHLLDVTDENSVSSTYEFIERKFGRLDILVNNAGVLFDPSRHPPKLEEASIFATDVETIRLSMETNTYGPIKVIQKLVPLMKANGYGRIVNVSSGMGQLAEMNGGWPGYRISKAALNAVTRIVSDELEGTNILINSVCPGWVRTDLGGPDAELSAAEGAETIIWLTTQSDNPITGAFFRGRERIDW